MSHQADDHYRSFTNTETGETLTHTGDRRRIMAIVGATIDDCQACVETESAWLASDVEAMLLMDRLMNWLMTQSEEGLPLQSRQGIERLSVERRRSMVDTGIRAMAYRCSGGDPIPLTVVPGFDPQARPRPQRVPRPGQRKRRPKRR